MKFFDVLQKVSELLLSWHKAKLSKQKKQEQKQKEDMIDDIASNGTIEDLLDLRNKNNKTKENYE